MALRFFLPGDLDCIFHCLNNAITINTFLTGYCISYLDYFIVAKTN